MYRPIIATLITAFMLGLFIACSHGPNRDEVTKQIVQDTQELFDAVAPGNKEPWTRYVADDVTYFDERGNNMDKKALIATIEPLPTGITGNISVVNSKFNQQGDTVIHSYDLNESESVHAQQMHARYHATDTWMKRNGRWQIVAGQIFRYYEDPAPGMMDTQKLRDYAGTYELAGDRSVVSLADGKLYLTRGTRTRTELIPEACDIFFRKGIEGRILFRRANGRVDSMIDRRNNEDIVWNKLR